MITSDDITEDELDAMLSDIEEKVARLKDRLRQTESKYRIDRFMDSPVIDDTK